MKPYDGTSWYWIVGGGATRYSSRVGNYVATSDPDYIVWLADGTLPSNIDTEYNLGKVLAFYAPVITVPIPAGILTGYNDELINRRAGTLREILNAARTYFVNVATGNDNNNGLTAATAFKTIQRAVDVVASLLDINGQNVTIKLASGTYSEAVPAGAPNIVTLRNVVGFQALGNLRIEGDTVTPSNVQVIGNSKNCFRGDYLSAVWDIVGMQMGTNTSGSAIIANYGTRIRFGTIDFGPCAAHHMTVAGTGSAVLSMADYRIIGGAACHFNIESGAYFQNLLQTVTITTPVTFGTAFCQVVGPCQAQCTASVYNGKALATGKRYNLDLNGVAVTGALGADPAFFPGTVAGTTARGGQYY